ncbi:MAG: hypothetical protein COV46_00835 [Deltaproteobacteria bacterium CG11_big_fil_rev_8_21_14_0_20_49_13]|nr:MAG: hypothetical protein COV46_00835 [Deltaproteobacteria bacterium CG11_big_fil_rev_8_21_14_0_20_49_13]
MSEVRSVILRTNEGSYLAGVKCEESADFGESSLSGALINGSDDIFFTLPGKGKTCIATLLNGSFKRERIDKPELRSKEKYEKMLEENVLREKRLAERLVLAEYPDARVMGVNLEPDTREVGTVKILEADPKIKEEIEDAVDSADLEKCDDFGKERGFQKFANLQSKLSKLSKEMKRVILITSIAEVNGRIDITILSSPLPRLVEIYDAEDPQKGLDLPLIAIRDIVGDVLKDPKKMAKFCANDPALKKEIEALIAKDRDIQKTGNDYNIENWNLDLSDRDMLRVFVKIERPVTHGIGSVDTLTEEEKGRFKAMTDQPLSNNAYSKKLKNIEETFAKEGFAIATTKRLDENGTVILDVVKFPNEPKSMIVTGEFPEDETDFIVKAFGKPPEGGFRMDSLYGDPSAKVPYGIAGVRAYLLNKGYIINELSIEPAGENISISLKLAKWEMGRLIIVSPEKEALSEKEMQKGSKRLQKTIESVKKEYGSRGEYISHETIGRVSAAVSRSIYTGPIQPVVTEEDGKAIINLVAKPREPEHDMSDTNIGYGTLGAVVSLGYAYDTGKGLLVGGQLKWNGEIDSWNPKNWDTTQLSLRLFVNKDLSEEDSIGITVYGFHTNFGGKKHSVVGTDVQYKRMIGENFSIGLGTTFEAFIQKNQTYGFEKGPVRAKPNFSLCYEDSRNTACVSGAVSIGAANYQEISTFYEHRLPLGVIYLDASEVEEAKESYVSDTKQGNKKYIPMLKFRVGGGIQSGKVPYLEQMSLFSAGAPFPISLYKARNDMASYVAGGSVVFEQPVCDEVTILIGAQSYMLGNSFKWGVAGGVSAFGMNLWLGYGSDGLIIYLSPAHLMQRNDPFKNLNKIKEDNSHVREQL